MKPLRPTRLEDLQPVVLVGGKSSRFGSDKLLAPLNPVSGKDSSLVTRPINALREVFGSRVMAVGTCSPDVVALADSHLDDQYPGAGPAGGILTVLEWLLAHHKVHIATTPCAAFVLSGDLARISSLTVKRLVEVALGIEENANPKPLAVWARTTNPEPCIGIYFLDAIPALRTGVCNQSAATKGSPNPPLEVTPHRTAGLHRLIVPDCRIEVPIPEIEALNINFKEDLRQVPESPKDSRTAKAT